MLIVRGLIGIIGLDYLTMNKKHPWLVSVGEKVKEARKIRGLSQEELAGLVGLDRTYLGGVERGERNIAALNIIRIAISLDIEVGSLFPSLDALGLAS